MSRTVLGLDIGGANLKAALSSGAARTQRFDFVSNTDSLSEALHHLTSGWNFDQIAVTMTAELCRCFASKGDGVRHITQQVATFAGNTPLQVWGLDGTFHATIELKDPATFAAGNWLALATFVGRWVPRGAAVLIDVGSTTTDIIPLRDGRPIPTGWTDQARMQSMELTYTGVRATPICALLGWHVMAETFATSHDANLVLGHLAEEPENCDTADSRPATRSYAHARLAQMLGGDTDSISTDETRRLAEAAFARQRGRIAEAIAKHRAGRTQIICGSGEFLARAACDKNTPIRSVSDELGQDISTAACAYAVAVLAAEQSVSL